MRDPYPMSKPTRSRRSLAEWWRSWWPWSVIRALRVEVAIDRAEVARLRDVVAGQLEITDALKRALWRQTEGDAPMPAWMRTDVRAHLRAVVEEGGGE